MPTRWAITNWRGKWAGDDWTQLLALTALLMLGEGTPARCTEWQRLMKKGLQQPAQFTFPAALKSITSTKDFRQQLPEVFTAIFRYDPNKPWLEEKLFDPAHPDAKYFLTKPHDFLLLTAATLDPEGETELGQWRLRQP